MNGKIVKFAKKILKPIRNSLYFKRVTDTELIDAFQREKCEKYLAKRYKKLLQSPKKILEETKPIKIIWICWLQGIENAPELVQSCFQSVEKYKNDYKIQLITEKNLSDFVALPDYILKKWKSGIISNTHFSDIVRACLLADYGGVWVDSTVLFLSNIPENIANLPLFMFRNEHKLDKSIVSSNWLISCFKNHPMLVEMKEFLFAYWKKEHKIKNYFLFHIYFTLLSKKYCEFWNDVPFISNINPHTLYFYDLFRQFDSQRFEDIKMLSFCQKLNYKQKLPPKIDGTFYDYLIKQKNF